MKYSSTVLLLFFTCNLRTRTFYYLRYVRITYYCTFITDGMYCTQCTVQYRTINNILLIPVHGYCTVPVHPVLRN